VLVKGDQSLPTLIILPSQEESRKICDLDPLVLRQQLANPDQFFGFHARILILAAGRQGF